MAKKRTSTPAKSKRRATAAAPKSKSAKKPVKATATAGTKDLPRAEFRGVQARLRGHYPALTEADRAAYASRISDAYCLEIGTRTRSEAVAREALAFFVALDQTYQKHSFLRDEFAPEHLGWMLDCTSALLDAMETQDAQVSGTVAARAVADTAETEARAIRKQLLRKLQLLVARREQDLQALENAAGTTATREATRLSLVALVAFAEQLHAHKDPHVRLLASRSGITPALLSAARERANALAEKSVDALAEGRKQSKDTTPVNLAEGRVTAEINELRSFYNALREERSELPPLVLGATLRKFFDRGTRTPAPVTPSPAPT